MSVIFIVFTAIIVIVAGLSASANRYGTSGGQMISMLSNIILAGLVISVFYNHGIKTGIIYAVVVFIVAGFFNKIMQPKF